MTTGNNHDYDSAIERALRGAHLSRRKFLALAAGSALLIACGDDDEADEQPTGSTATTAPAQASATPEPTTRQFEDSLGNTVEIPAAPQRIVALHDYNVATIMLSLGVTPAASVGRNGGLEVLERQYDVSQVVFLGQYGEPDIEAIAALQPDLIVGAVQNEQPGWIPEGALASLEQIAPTVFIDHIRTVPEVTADYAALLGTEQDFENLKTAYAERVAGLKEKYADKLSQTTVAVVSFYYMQWGINVPDQPGIDGVMSDLGVNQIKPEADSPDRANFISAERMSEIDADLLIALRYADSTPAPGDVALFDQLAVARAGQAYEVDGTAWIERSYNALGLILDSFEEWLPDLDPTVLA